MIPIPSQSTIDYIKYLSPESLEQEKNKNGFLHKIEIIQKNTQASDQGSLFFVKVNEKPGEQFILKVFSKQNFKAFVTESNVLFQLKEKGHAGKGFPEVISSIWTDERAEILMQALGPNLGKLYKQNPQKHFSDGTIFKIVIQLVDRLECLHSIGFVHNDIKLENIVVGGEDNREIFLIDFGLAHRFWNDSGWKSQKSTADPKHVEKEQLNKFSGTFMFASLNSCRGYNKSRRDDLESAFYLLAYLLNQCDLPWTKIKKNVSANFQFSDAIKMRLNIENTKKLIRSIPEQLIKVFKEVLTLSFKEKPQYSSLTEQLQTNLDRVLCENTSQPNASVSSQAAVPQHNFEWTVQNAPDIRAMMLQQCGSMAERQTLKSIKLQNYSPNNSINMYDIASVDVNAQLSNMESPAFSRSNNGSSMTVGLMLNKDTDSLRNLLSAHPQRLEANGRFDTDNKLPGRKQKKKPQKSAFAQARDSISSYRSSNMHSQQLNDREGQKSNLEDQIVEEQKQEEKPEIKQESPLPIEEPQDFGEFTTEEIQEDFNPHPLFGCQQSAKYHQNSLANLHMNSYHQDESNPQIHQQQVQK